MFSLLLEQLKAALDDLRLHAKKTAEALKEDPDFLSFLPVTDHLPEGFDPRQAVIDSITDLNHHAPNETNPHLIAGVICVTGRTISQVKMFNESKANFKAVMVDIRKQLKNKKLSISQSLAVHLEEQLNDDDLPPAELEHWQSLDTMFRRLSFESIDLTRAYAQIRLLDDDVISVSWSWSTKHKSITKVTLAEAITMANELPVENTKEIALDLLGKLSGHEKLAVVYTKTNAQLVANTLTREGERKALKVSGVLVIEGSALPLTLLWRERKDDVRRTRFDSKIENEPYIKALSLYRYLAED